MIRDLEYGWLELAEYKSEEKHATSKVIIYIPFTHTLVPPTRYRCIDLLSVVKEPFWTDERARSTSVDESQEESNRKVKDTVI